MNNSLNGTSFNPISHQYIQTAMEDRNVPGLAIAIVKNGQVLLTEGFGQISIDQGGTVDDRTLFTIGSCTKAFATTALAILVEEKYVRDYLGKTLVQHGGYVDGFTSFNLLCPETNLGVAVLTNMHSSLLPFALAYRVVDADFGQPEYDWSGHFLQKRAEHRRMVSPHAEENARIAKDY